MKLKAKVAFLSGGGGGINALSSGANALGNAARVGQTAGTIF